MYGLQKSLGQNADEHGTCLSWGPLWLAAGTSILWVQTFLIKVEGSSNPNAKLPGRLETAIQKWPVDLLGPGKTLAVSGL